MVALLVLELGVEQDGRLLRAGDSRRSPGGWRGCGGPSWMAFLLGLTDSKPAPPWSHSRFPGPAPGSSDSCSRVPAPPPPFSPSLLGPGARRRRELVKSAPLPPVDRPGLDSPCA